MSISPDKSSVLINENLDPSLLRRDLERSGRIRISNVLKPAVAAEVRNYLESRVPWELAYMDGGEAVTLNAGRMHRLSQQERSAIQERIFNQARSGFQFTYGHYSLIHAVNEGLLDGTILERFVNYINSEHFIGFARTLTGNGEITNAEVQSSRYDRGHFLTRHNDSADPDRRYAIVFGFTRNWIADWGGLTVFYDAAGSITESFVPSYNSLVLFKVPVWHSVTFVTPFAGEVRYSITGWLRV